VRRPLGGNDRGQVAVEFMGMLPLILVVLALLWQLVLVGYAYALAAHSADRGARAGTATEGGGAGACRAAAEAELPGSWRGGATIACSPAGGVWKAKVRIEVPVLFPGAGSFSLPAQGSAGAAQEDPR